MAFGLTRTITTQNHALYHQRRGKFNGYIYHGVCNSWCCDISVEVHFHPDSVWHSFHCQHSSVHLVIQDNTIFIPSSIWSSVEYLEAISLVFGFAALPIRILMVALIFFVNSTTSWPLPVIAPGQDRRAYMVAIMMPYFVLSPHRLLL